VLGAALAEQARAVLGPQLSVVEEKEQVVAPGAGGVPEPRRPGAGDHVAPRGGGAEPRVADEDATGVVGALVFKGGLGADDGLEVGELAAVGGARQAGVAPVLLDDGGFEVTGEALGERRLA
jgi:hypothetical protein